MCQTVTSICISLQDGEKAQAQAEASSGEGGSKTKQQKTTEVEAMKARQACCLLPGTPDKALVSRLRPPDFPTLD